MISTTNVDRMLTSSRYIRNTGLHASARVDCGRENLDKIKQNQSELFKTYALAKQKGYIRQWVRQCILRTEGQFVFLSGCMLDRYRAWYDYWRQIESQCKSVNKKDIKMVGSNLRHAKELYEYCRVIKTTLSLMKLCFIDGVRYDPNKFKSVTIVIEEMCAQVSGYLSLIPKRIKYINGQKQRGSVSQVQLGTRICSMVNIKNLSRPLSSLKTKKIIDGIDSKKPDPGRNKKFQAQVRAIQPSVTNEQLHAGLAAHRRRMHGHYIHATKPPSFKF